MDKYSSNITQQQEYEESINTRTNTTTLNHQYYPHQRNQQPSGMSNSMIITPYHSPQTSMIPHASYQDSKVRSSFHHGQHLPPFPTIMDTNRSTLKSTTLASSSSDKQHQDELSFGSKATNMSYEQPTFGLPPIQDSNSLNSSSLENKPTTTVNNHHNITINTNNNISIQQKQLINTHPVLSSSVITSQYSPSSLPNNHHRQHTVARMPNHQHVPDSASAASTEQAIEILFSNQSGSACSSGNSSRFITDPSPNNSLNMVGHQSKNQIVHKSSDYSAPSNNSYYHSQPHVSYDHLNKRMDARHSTCNMHEMLEFDLHLSNSDMRQLYSDGYYNPSLLAQNPSNNSSGTICSTTSTSDQGGASNLTRIDYIKCTPNGVFSSFGKSATDSNSSSSSHSQGRTSPDNSETQGLTWYENQQVVLHLWVRIKEQTLNQFKTIFDDFTSGNLNPAFSPPLKFHILYKNAEFPAKEVLVHEFSLDPIQCYQKYLKNKEVERQDEKSVDPLLVYSRNMDFSLERKTVKVVNKRLKVRFEMIALPCSSEGTNRISLLLSPAIVCLTARSFFFDKRRIKTAKGGSGGGISGTTPPSSASSPNGPITTPPQQTSNSGVASSCNSHSSSSPVGSKLRQLGSSAILSDNSKSNSLICEENPSGATFNKGSSTNHSYSPYPSPLPPSRTQVAQLSTSPNTQPSPHPDLHQQQYYNGGIVHRSPSVPAHSYPNGPTITTQGNTFEGGIGGSIISTQNNHQQVGGYHQHYIAPPQQNCHQNYRSNFSASSLIENSPNNHYPEPVANNISPFSHVKQSPPNSSGTSSLPSLSSIFQNAPLVGVNTNSVSIPNTIPQTATVYSRSEPTPFAATITTNSRNQFLQLSIPVHSLPKEFMDMNDSTSSNELLVNDFLEFMNSKYRKHRSFSKLQ